MRKSEFISIAMVVAVCLFTGEGMVVHAADGDVDVESACKLLPTHDALHTALVAAQMQKNADSTSICGVRSSIGMESCVPLRSREALAATSGRVAE